MLQLKAQKKCNANKNEKDAVVKVQYILISEEVDYQRQTEIFYNDKGLSHQRDMRILNIYAPKK